MIQNGCTCLFKNNEIKMSVLEKIFFIEKSNAEICT